MPRFDDSIVRTIGDFVSALQRTAATGLVWFRGQENADWKLIPSLARSPEALAAELVTMKRFKQNAAPYLSSRPSSDWEWVFLMQHHRAPTRLLDWSESPLVALFFALGLEESDTAPDAAIWCMDPIALNKFAGHRRLHASDILAFEVDKSLDEYLPDKVNERVAALNPVAAIGPRNSPRMVAQAGTFTVIHAEPTAIEDVGDQNHIWKFIIPADSRASLKQELSLLGIREHSIFPDLDRVAKLAKEMIR